MSNGQRERAEADLAAHNPESPDFLVHMPAFQLGWPDPSECNRCRSDRDLLASLDREAALKEALKKYGRHLEACMEPWGDEVAPTCECGFRPIWRSLQ